MKVIGKQGDSRFLVQISSGNKGESRILDINTKQFFPPFKTQSILARGYWEKIERTKKDLDKLLIGIKLNKKKK